MIAPSILNADNLELGKKISEAVSAGVTRFHLDIMDGHFVPNLSFGPELVKDFKEHFPEIEAEIHLMSDRPDLFVSELIKNGADIILLHYEAMNEDELLKWIEYIKKKNVKIGIALNPDTPVATIDKFLKKIDQVLIMSVFPGFGGQTFITEVLNKIKILKKSMYDQGVDLPIEVDGGINEKTAKISLDAGAEILVAGSFVYGHKSVAKQLQILEGLK